MIVRETGLPGCRLVQPELLEDDRGFFARTFDTDDFRYHGLNPCIAQSSISFNRTAGTLRGLHFQASPHEEAKLVRCSRGRVFDVAVDLRSQSSSYLQWRGFELNDENRLAIYIPEGFAHAFLTLTDDVELLYDVSVAYVSDSARGIRWNDPTLQIAWPHRPECISTRDQHLPLIAELRQF